MKFLPILLMALAIPPAMGTLDLLFGRFLEVVRSDKKVDFDLDNMQSSWTYCALCKTVVGVVSDFFKGGQSEDALVKVLSEGCVVLGVESRIVCEGMMNGFRDEVFTVLRETTLSAHDICSLAFNQQCGAPSNAVEWVVPTSGVSKPPVEPRRLPAKDAPTIQVVQISDTHVDTQYKYGAIVDCADPLCCREDSTRLKRGGTDRVAGFWGSMANCDIPERTYIASLDYIGTAVKPKYIYWTGDIMPHNVWQGTREGNKRHFQDTVRFLKSLTPGAKVFPAMGNHEGVPVDSFPIPQITGNRSVKWLYETLADVWAVYLPEESLKTFRTGGYYSYQLHHKLRIISMNTNYCNNFNWWLLINSTDPTGQLAWLTKELQECENKGIKVHILGHIPPGRADCLSVWSNNYNDILNRYENTIAGQFYGHTHYDEFSVFFDKTNTSRAYDVGYIAPSLTTFGVGQPAFREYKIDGLYDNSTFQVLDYATHYMNLLEANTHPNESYVPEWSITPSVMEFYNLPSLLPQEWSNFAYRLSIDDELFSTFYRIYMKNMPDAKPADRKKIICHLVTSRSGAPCIVNGGDI